jgi:two-component system cell cycle response regulator DivK
LRYISEMTRNIIAVVDDLFFASKIRGTAEALGVRVRFARSVEATIEAARQDKPAFVICDLHSQKVDPLEVAKQLKADGDLRSIPLLGFFSHVQTEVQRQAEAAGFDRVLPRSAFTKNLVGILSGTG